MCQLNLNSVEVKRKIVQPRIEQQQMSSARPPGSDPGVLGVLIVFVATPSVQLRLERGLESLAPTKEQFPILFCVTGFLCESK